MKLAALGPEGTYSSQAAHDYAPDAELVLVESIPAAILKVAQTACKGIIPLENSIEGTVRQSFDGLFKYNLVVEDELEMDIHHTLWSAADPVSARLVQEIHSHEQALSQCSGYLDVHYPNAKRVLSSSTAAAVEHVDQTQDPTVLAIGPDFAGEGRDLTAIDQEIEDEAGNTTEFVVFSKEASQNTQLDFTMAAFVPEHDRRGLLKDITAVIADADVNLLRIEARPSRTELGNYIFYARMDMPSGDPRYQQIAEELAGSKDGAVKTIRMSA